MNRSEPAAKPSVNVWQGSLVARAKAFLGCLGFFLLLAPGLQGAPGPTNTAPKQLSNRWLIVVQTTKSMAPRAPAAANLAAMLAATGMSGQMRGGDTLGLWTFDQELHTGVFPLQMWTYNTRKAIADRVFDFVKAQKFEKEGHLNYVVYDMERVVRGSEYITVVLITDGMEDVHGTPFDEKINAVYGTWRKDQAKAKIPFITVLRAERGHFTNCAVTVPPWPVELPPPSPGLLAAQKAASRPQGSPPEIRTNPPVILAPLIVSGKKRDAEPTSAAPAQSGPTNIPAATAPAAPQTETAKPPPAVPQAPAPAPVAAPAAAESTAVAAAPPPGNKTGDGIVPASATNAAAPLADAAPSQPEPAPTPPPPRPEPVASPSAAAAAPATPPSTAPPSEHVTLADLLSRKNGWVIPLGVAGLVLASFALGVVFSMYRRMHSPGRISLVTPKPAQEKSEKKVI